MGPGSDGPLGAMAGMEPHHMNGSLGNVDLVLQTTWKMLWLHWQTEMVFKLYVKCAKLEKLLEGM